MIIIDDDETDNTANFSCQASSEDIQASASQTQTQSTQPSVAQTTAPSAVQQLQTFAQSQKFMLPLSQPTSPPSQWTGPRAAVAYRPIRPAPSLTKNTVPQKQSSPVSPVSPAPFKSPAVPTQVLSRSTSTGQSERQLAVSTATSLSTTTTRNVLGYRTLNPPVSGGVALQPSRVALTPSRPSVPPQQTHVPHSTLTASSPTPTVTSESR